MRCNSFYKKKFGRAILLHLYVFFSVILGEGINERVVCVFGFICTFRCFLFTVIITVLPFVGMQLYSDEDNSCGLIRLAYFFSFALVFGYH